MFLFVFSCTSMKFKNIVKDNYCKFFNIFYLQFSLKKLFQTFKNLFISYKKMLIEF